jgi:hypothetical protein
MAQTPIPTPAQQRLIYWPAVFGAAISSLLLVGVMTATIWATGRPIARNETAVVIAMPAQGVDETASPLPALGDIPGEPELTPELPVVAAPIPTIRRVEPAELPKVASVRPRAASATPIKQTYGTQVSFFNNPDDAARQAARENKLLFMLHLSGNLEDDCFT